MARSHRRGGGRRGGRGRRPGKAGPSGADEAGNQNALHHDDRGGDGLAGEGGGDDDEHTKLGDRFLAYDGYHSLFIAGALPFDSEEYEVTLSACVEKRRMRVRKYKVVIKHAAAISLLQLRMLFAGYPTDIPAHALQVLDTVRSDIVFNRYNDENYIAAGRSLFSRNFGCMKDGALDVEAWKGLYQIIMQMQNGLSVLVDLSSSVFIQPLQLLDFVQKTLGKDALNRKLTKPEYTKACTFSPARIQNALCNVKLLMYIRCSFLNLQLFRAVRGVRIEVTHQGDERYKYRIAGLSVKPTNLLSFKSPSGARHTVIDYFKKRYNLELKFKYLPCLDVGSEQKSVYIPIEVCKIVPRQRYQKKLDDSQVSILMKSTFQIQPEPKQSIHEDVEHKQYSSTKRANEFGIDVDGILNEVNARVLLPPNLKYHDSGSQKTWSPMNGYWNMKDKRVVNGAKISNWACVNFCEDLSNNSIGQFCLRLAEMSRITGVEKLKGYVRQILVSCQCCRKSTISKKSKKSNQILANIAIKINSKAGGRNSVFDDTQKSLPVVSNKPTIIFGAHVTRPSAVADPSIAAVVASQDWHEVSKYNGVVRAQGHRKEIITDLEDIVKELLHAFEKESNRRPQQLIFYRYGVCESQFKQVLEIEIPEIEKAWKVLYDNEKPQITFIVLQKRHSLSLFPNTNKYKHHVAKKQNVMPGTVVDSQICHPAEFDFFLCSNPEVRGPIHPVQYLVLRDDNNFTADELQVLTNNLCYTYASCTQVVSIAPPAYYAHRLAHRAHLYLAQGSNHAAAAASSSSGANAPAGGPKQLPEIKDELKRSMFYC
nr:unnamed protein product [Digitaria exilis]